MGRTKRARRQPLRPPATASPDSAWPVRTRGWLAAVLLVWIALVYAPSLGNGFTYDDPSIVEDASELLSRPAARRSAVFGGLLPSVGRVHVPARRDADVHLDWQIGGGTGVGVPPAEPAVASRHGRMPDRPAAEARRQRRSFNTLPPPIYGVHPALTEAVDAIAFREDVLVVAFGLLGLLVLTGSWPRAAAMRLAAGTLCFAAALFSKESGLVFAALLPLTHWAIARHATPGERWRPSRYALQYLSLVAVRSGIPRDSLLAPAGFRKLRRSRERFAGVFGRHGWRRRRVLPSAARLPAPALRRLPRRRGLCRVDGRLAPLGVARGVGWSDGPGVVASKDESPHGLGLGVVSGIACACPERRSDSRIHGGALSVLAVRRARGVRGDVACPGRRGTVAVGDDDGCGGALRVQRVDLDAAARLVVQRGVVADHA